MGRDDVAARLRAAKPGSSRRSDPLSPRALAELAQFELLAHASGAPPSPPTPGRDRRKRAILAACTLAVALIVATAVLTVWVNVTPERAVALTPPPLTIRATSGTAREALIDAAEKRLHDVAAHGSRTVRYYQWALESSVADDGTITSSPSIPQERTLKIASGGRVTLLARAAPAFPGEASAGLPRAGTVLDEQHYPPGKYDNPYAKPAPSTPNAVRRYLDHALGVRKANAGEYLRAVSDLLGSRPVTAAQESAILKFLARQRGLSLLGTTTDRLHRRGTVFLATDRRPGQYQDLLILDPSTGKMIAFETVYIGHDRSDIPSPATTYYVAWKR